MTFLVWPGRVQRTFFCSKGPLCRATVALYRSTKAPFMPKRGHTVGLKGTSVILGGAFDGLGGIALV